VPSSRAETIPAVLRLVMEWNPRSILDAGAGMGKWGVLFREYLEVWQGRLGRQQWQHKIDACEIYRPYVEAAQPVYAYAYDRILYGDVREMDVSQYDLLFLGDVIEHLPREDGKKLLEKAKNYIVVTPLYESGQDTSFGNEHERHVSSWTPDDFGQSQEINGRYLVAWRNHG
jgi:hypothetical protein